jgi:hypothetical protein
VSEFGRRRFVGRDIWLTEMVHRIGHGSVLSRCEFDRCNIVGPAVIQLIECTGERCATHDPLGTIGWPSDPPASTPRAGLIVLRHCVLRDCTFEQIGIVGLDTLPFELVPAAGNPPRRTMRGPRPPAGRQA